MANGDIANTDILVFLELGSLGTGKDTEIDTLCNEINSEVNLVLKNLGIALPVSDADSLNWLKLTKTFGAGSLTLEKFAAQDTEEENSRAQRLWERYRERLGELISSGGNILEADFQTDPIPNTLPTLVGEFDPNLRKRFLRFPQRVAADQYTDERELTRTRAGWKRAIRGL